MSLSGMPRTTQRNISTASPDEKPTDTPTNTTRPGIQHSHCSTPAQEKRFHPLTPILTQRTKTKTPHAIFRARPIPPAHPYSAVQFATPRFADELAYRNTSTSHNHSRPFSRPRRTPLPQIRNSPYRTCVTNHNILQLPTPSSPQSQRNETPTSP